MRLRIAAAVLLPVLLCGCQRQGDAGVRTVSGTAVAAAVSAAAADTLPVLTVRAAAPLPDIRGLLDNMLRTEPVSRSLLRDAAWELCPEENAARLTFRFSYALPEHRVRAMKRAAQQTAREWAESAAGLPETVRYLYLYHRLLHGCEYAADAGLAGHSACGALCDGKAVCEGYAEALLLLCRESGIPCLLVPGTAWAARQPHAWNLVYLRGAWYHADTAQDDCDPTASHRCFLMTDAQASRQYIWDAAVYPAADGQPVTYADAVAEMVRSGS